MPRDDPGLAVEVALVALGGTGEGLLEVRLHRGHLFFFEQAEDRAAQELVPP